MVKHEIQKKAHNCVYSINACRYQITSKRISSFSFLCIQTLYMKAFLSHKVNLIRQPFHLIQFCIHILYKDHFEVRRLLMGQWIVRTMHQANSLIPIMLFSLIYVRPPNSYRMFGLRNVVIHHLINPHIFVWSEE